MADTLQRSRLNGVSVKPTGDQGEVPNAGITPVLVGANGSPGAESVRGPAHASPSTVLEPGDPANVPVLPHITTNILPLATIVQNLAEHAALEIYHTITTLPNVLEPDVAKKRRVLELIVRLRKDFVKLFVLAQWSSHAEAFHQLIDVLAFLRTEQIHLFNSIWGMQLIGPSLATAKLPNPDLRTALEVFIYGRPQLPTHGLVARPPLTAQAVLATLHRLNVLLAVRLALAPELPPRFRQYEIRDGRVVFEVPREFVALVSIASETEDDTPFFLVEFRFCFGFVDDDYVIHDHLTTEPPLANRMQLERLANATLHRRGLSGLYDLLHHYATTYKLYLVHKQLASIRLRAVWRGHLHHTYTIDKSTITITYWGPRHAPKSYLEVGINRRHELSYRWFKEGRLVGDVGGEPLVSNGNSDGDEADGDRLEDPLPQGLDIERTLQRVLTTHVEQTMRDVYEAMLSQLALRAEGEAASLVRLLLPSRMHYQLTHLQHTVVSMDAGSGQLYFEHPTQQMASFVPALNRDLGLVAKIVHMLIVIRLEILTAKVMLMLTAVEWIANDVVKISPVHGDEWAKLDMSSRGSVNVQFLRRREWPQGWFLICGVNGYLSSLHWRVAQIKALLGVWQVQWIDKINLLADASGAPALVVCDPRLYKGYFDYDTLAELAHVSANKIMSHLILQELQAQGCKVVAFPSARAVVAASVAAGHDPKDAFLAAVSGNGADDRDLVIVIDKDLLMPIPDCHAALYLKIKLVDKYVRLSIYGKLLPDMNVADVGGGDQKPDPHGCHIELDNTSKVFQIHHLVETLRLGVGGAGLQAVAADGSPSHSVLSTVLGQLSKLFNLISILNVLRRSRVEILLTTLDSVRFAYDNEAAVLVLGAGTVGNQVRLEVDASNPHSMVQRQLDNILGLFGLDCLVQTLHESLPLVRVFQQLQQKSHLQTDVRWEAKQAAGQRHTDVQFQVVSREVTYFELQYVALAYQVDAGDDPLPQVSKREAADLVVRLRLLWGGQPMFFISLRAQRPFMKQYWRKGQAERKGQGTVQGAGEAPELVSRFATVPGKVVALGTGLACDAAAVLRVVQLLHDDTMAQMLQAVRE